MTVMGKKLEKQRKQTKKPTATTITITAIVKNRQREIKHCKGRWRPRFHVHLGPSDSDQYERHILNLMFYINLKKISNVFERIS